MTRKLSPLLVLVAGVACASAPLPTEGELTREGRTLVRFTGTELQSLVSFRWADGHLGDEWLVLAVWLSGGSAATTTVDRDGIRLRGPDGTRYPLPSQEAFRAAYGELQLALRNVDFLHPPASGFAGLREPCGRWFLASPWEGFAYDTVFVTPFRYCSGPLAFLVPGGVQPGRWVLEIDLPESKVRIPFVLGEAGGG
ncbi:MAG TPA: hypothetical protein PLS95_08555 [Thermoanaerobaculales bacterium]|nr:hypothetical protein [Thermoanaerobaculales bacterium]HQN96463.1 hypothetical protein [Thermoanaerobaculales bacterium]HQP43549.1 hypothetical protein [Thermoanaerobaculales bacterium]